MPNLATMNFEMQDAQRSRIPFYSFPWKETLSYHDVVMWACPQRSRLPVRFVHILFLTNICFVIFRGWLIRGIHGACSLPIAEMPERQPSNFRRRFGQGSINAHPCVWWGALCIHWLFNNKNLVRRTSFSRHIMKWTLRQIIDFPVFLSTTGNINLTQVHLVSLFSNVYYISSLRS